MGSCSSSVSWHPIAAYPIHVAAMIAIGAPAALVPARRAIGVEPSVLLREE